MSLSNKGHTSPLLIWNHRRGSSRCSHINTKSPSPDFDIIHHPTSHPLYNSSHLSLYLNRESQTVTPPTEYHTHHQGIFSSHSSLCNLGTLSTRLLPRLPSSPLYTITTFGNPNTYILPVSIPTHPITHQNVYHNGDPRSRFLLPSTGINHHDNHDSCQGVDRVPSYAVLAETA